MKSTKNTLKTEIHFDDSLEHRYLLRIEWNKDKKKACVIMLSASHTNGISFDHTTNYVLENLFTLNYGSVDIVNLFSTIDKKVEASEDEINLKTIETSIKNSDTIIFATGTSYKTNNTIKLRQNKILDILSNYSEKLYCIADSNGQRFYHPLCPRVRKWNLQSFNIKELLNEENNKDD